MAELRPFATAKQAADIGGITPTDIGVSATAFVRKSELVRTGKFDETSLASYQGAWFVNLDAVKKASGGSLLHIEWLPFDTIAADAMEASTFISCQGTTNDPVITVTGMLKNVTTRVEKYIDNTWGWTHRIYLTFDKNASSEQLTSTVMATLTDGDQTVSRSVTITQSAAIDEFDVQPRTLSFTSDGGDGVLTITAPNRDWTAIVDDELVTPKLEIDPTSVDFEWNDTKGANIDVSTNGLEFEGNVTYDDPSAGDWLELSTDGIEGLTTIVSAKSSNTSGSVRTAKVTFTLKSNATVKAVLTVSQQTQPVTPKLEIDPTSLSFTDDPTSGKTGQVSATGNWTIE